MRGAATQIKTIVSTRDVAMATVEVNCAPPGGVADGSGK